MNEKDVYCRLKALLAEKKQLEEDIKQLCKDAKEYGIDGKRLKTLAKADVDGTMEKKREEFEALQAAARSVGVDALEIEPELPLAAPAPRSATDDRVDELIGKMRRGEAIAMKRDDAPIAHRPVSHLSSGWGASHEHS